MRIFLIGMVSLALCCILAVGLLLSYSRNAGSRMRKKFDTVGTFEGKSYEQIVTIVGPPQTVERSREGTEILKWMSAEYNISLTFRNEICENAKVLDLAEKSRNPNTKA